MLVMYPLATHWAYVFQVPTVVRLRPLVAKHTVQAVAKMQCEQWHHAYPQEYIDRYKQQERVPYKHNTKRIAVQE